MSKRSNENGHIGNDPKRLRPDAPQPATMAAGGGPPGGLDMTVSSHASRVRCDNPDSYGSIFDRLFELKLRQEWQHSDRHPSRQRLVLHLHLNRQQQQHQRLYHQRLATAH